MTQYHIEVQVPQSGQTNYYYPLTSDEIIDLLETARTWKQQRGGREAAQSIASIQIRLAQGIPGIMVPYDTDGTVAEKHSKLDEAFVKWIQDREKILLNPERLTRESQIVRELWQLMN